MAETTILGIEHIVKTPGVISGRPRIAGRRIGVDLLVYEHLQLKASIDEIAESHDLTHAQIYAALAYYYDHREEIEQHITENLQAQERMMQSPYAFTEAEQEALREKWRAKRQARIDALPDPNREMTVSEVAETYGISTQAVREACKEGWIEARKSGTTWLIRHADAEERWGGRSAQGG